MAKPTAEEFLKHHGVLGQKWGTHKGPSRRVQLRSALNTKLTTSPFTDDRSEKSMKLGRAATSTALGAVGSFLIGRAAKDPRVKLGFNAVTIALSATSTGLTLGERHSEQTDVINKYGSK